MRINGSNRPEPLRPNGRKASAKQTPKGESPASSDRAEIGQVQAMVGDLIEMPEVREEVTALGRRLAGDPAYPPKEVVEEVAKILAKALRV